MFYIPNLIDYLYNQLYKMYFPKRLKTSFNKDKLYNNWLLRNPNAVNLLEKNLDRVEWNALSANTNAKFN